MIQEIPFFSFDKINSDISPDIQVAFQDFLLSKSYILGDKLAQFEDEFAKYIGTQYTIGVSNGLDALFLSLISLDVGPGDEVIVPANTFIATIIAVLQTGAKPILVEPDIFSYNIDAKNVRKAISKNTKAIIPVHLYGNPCNMSEILKISKEFDVQIVEDNAQAQGAFWDRKRTGSFGILSATSFYPVKNLGALGDAGAISTSSKILRDRLHRLRNYGSDKKYHYQEIGYNKRLDECQAVFLSIKLDFLDIWNNARREIASIYNRELKSLNTIVIPYEDELAQHVYHLYVIRTKQRDNLKRFLQTKGIGTMVHYPIPPHKQFGYKHLHFYQKSFPITEELAGSSLSLPIYPGLSRGEIEYICKSIKEFFNG